VPAGIRGQLTAKVRYDTRPFKIICRETKLTVE
jgi:hypothetical protein